MSESTIDPETGIEVYYFAGQRRFRCPRRWEGGGRCQYDTYDLQQLKSHMSGAHSRTGEPAKRKQSVSPILNHEGKAIIHEIPEEKEVPPEFRNLNFRTNK